jgi:hypothetical protein
MGRAEKSQAIKVARVLQGKRRAILLLDSCLAAHSLDPKEHENIVNGKRNICVSNVQ